MGKANDPQAPSIETEGIRAAAINTGAPEHTAAVNPDVANILVKAFTTFTHDLYDLSDWFKSYSATSVTMKSTGA